MHVSAGDVLLRLDETQLRANAQVLTQQLDQTRVRTTPQLEGLVSYVSADLNHDRQKNPNAGPYYTVRVTLHRASAGGSAASSWCPACRSRFSCRPEAAR
jgi:multidrug resistance efflux pump